MIFADWKYFKCETSKTDLITKDEGDGCYYGLVPGFVGEIGYLPTECRECYKALIFWPYSKSNTVSFGKMLKDLPVSVHGKYNESVVVFYFRDKAKMLSFLDLLGEKMGQFGVEGRIQWRVSGKYWQDAYPQFFDSAKELRPVPVGRDMSIREWLRQKGFVV